MMRKVFVVFAIVMIATAMSGISQAMEGYVNIGIGKLEGDTTYRIGGKTYGPGDSGIGELPFPISELAFDIDAYMLSLGAGAKFGKDWELGVNVKKNIATGDGVLKDTDFEYQVPIIYSDSDAQLDIWSVDANLKYRFVEGLYLGVGYTYQKLDYDVRDFRQWDPQVNDGTGIYGAGLGLTYDVQYHIPYMEIGAKGNITDEISLDSSLRYAPAVWAKDRDNHVARHLYSTADCKGHAVMWMFRGRYDFPRNWFMTLEFDYTKIATSGDSKNYVYEQWQSTIDEEIESSQMYFTFVLGYRF